MSVLIGITPDTHDGSKLHTRTEEEMIVYLWDSYLKALIDHGATPVVLPVTANKARLLEMMERLDGLVLAGGNFDVPSEYYNQEPREHMGKLKPERSAFELAILKLAMKIDAPVLGICGGMQIINVAMGGTLYQDILEERPDSLDHQQEIPRTEPLHAVAVASRTLLHRIVSGGKRKAPIEIQVNSTHHQAVDKVGRGLAVSGAAPDGVIEAIESRRHKFVVGVQWHPELLYPAYPEQSRLLKALVRAARSYQRRSRSGK